MFRVEAVIVVNATAWPISPGAHLFETLAKKITCKSACSFVFDVHLPQAVLCFGKCPSPRIE
jgi:hypothetical protein